VDDLYEIEDILPEEIKNKYAISLSPTLNATPDELHIGYVRIEKLLQSDL
jgi:hypothetical protein